MTREKRSSSLHLGLFFPSPISQIHWCAGGGWQKETPDSSFERQGFQRFGNILGIYGSEEFSVQVLLLSFSSLWLCCFYLQEVVSLHCSHRLDILQPRSAQRWNDSCGLQRLSRADRRSLRVKGTEAVKSTADHSCAIEWFDKCDSPLNESAQQEYCRILCFDFNIKLWKIIFSPHLVNFSCLFGELWRLPVNTMCVL